MMDLTQLANLGEFIGGVAVLVTLVYLAVQVRHNTQAIMTNAEISGADEALFGYGAVAQNDELAELLLQGGADYESLDLKGKFKFGCHWQGVLIAHQNFFFLSERGALSAEVWGTYSRQFDGLIGMPGLRQWWRETKIIFDPRFVKYIDGKLASIGTPGQHA